MDKTIGFEYAYTDSSGNTRGGIKYFAGDDNCLQLNKYISNTIGRFKLIGFLLYGNGYGTTYDEDTASGLFYSCSNLVYADFTGFDTTNITNMKDMFTGCSKIQTLDLSEFNTSNVTDMSNMFFYNLALETLNIKNFTSNSLETTASMFYYDTKLKTIYCNNDLKPNGEDYTSSLMFFGCSSLVGAIPYASNKTDGTYANPTTGYFTRIGDNPLYFNGIAITDIYFNNIKVESVYFNGTKII